jgi:GTP:adenosylcobinamide-phosphate guanylyltransferase|tara:strand:- start:258 stop:485 length:228 start_codon:yes stop_codon:yes gene_type:complete
MKITSQNAAIHQKMVYTNIETLDSEDTKRSKLMYVPKTLANINTKEDKRTRKKAYEKYSVNIFLASVDNIKNLLK